MAPRTRCGTGTDRGAVRIQTEYNQELPRLYFFPSLINVMSLRRNLDSEHATGVVPDSRGGCRPPARVSHDEVTQRPVQMHSRRTLSGSTIKLFAVRRGPKTTWSYRRFGLSEHCCIAVGLSVFVTMGFSLLLMSCNGSSSPTPAMTVLIKLLFFGPLSTVARPARRWTP